MRAMGNWVNELAEQLNFPGFILIIPFEQNYNRCAKLLNGFRVPRFIAPLSFYNANNP